MNIDYENEKIKLSRIIRQLLETDISDKNGLLRLRTDTNNLRALKEAEKKGKLEEGAKNAMFFTKITINGLLKKIREFPDEINVFKKNGIINVYAFIHRIQEQGRKRDGVTPTLFN